MPHATLANSTDLDHWADRIVSRSEVPRLLRRLIHATCQDVQRIGFPADEGVQLSGWDGVVQAAIGNAYVPLGVSVWEAGSNMSIKAKADEDYEKRSQDPLNVLPDDSTFIFITPRRWAGKADWIAARNTDGIWREVRAYDAEDLAQWLEQAPAVHIWLSELIGKRYPGARSLDDFWTEWANETRPSLPPSLVVGGRLTERDQTLTWLRSAASPFSLAAESATETIAFLASALQELEAEERAKILARVVVVENAEAWRSLGPAPTPLVLVPNFANPEGVGRIVLQGHHVFVPLDRVAAAGATILPRLVRAVAEQALLSAGLSHERASHLATLARVSLSALRRTIAVAPGLLAPAWARPDVARELLAPLLAGIWQSSAEGDRAALANLVGTSYEEFQPVLTRKTNESEPALRHTNDVWMMAGRIDAWQRLASYLTEEDLKRFEITVLDVLSEIDPALDLPPDHRSIAGLFGKVRLHSGHLRDGIAAMLAIMAASEPSHMVAPGLTSKDFSERLVRLLMARAKGNIELWASLSSQLPTLAEAAPDVFLDAVSEGLAGDAPILVGMFQDQEQSLFGSSPHTGLLWALETLAWNTEHFGRAVLSLARLSRLDPGGRMGNRPANSLRDIFLCWSPNTNAPLAKRLTVLDTMRRREPEVGWHLMMQLLPKMHSSVSPTHKPQWRDWVPDSAGDVTVSEFIQATDAILDRLLSDAGATVLHWCDLIEAVGEMTPSQRDTCLVRLEALGEDLFSTEERAEVQDKLLQVIGRHREFPDADWAMPVSDADRLERAYDRFQPKDPIAKWRWLFKSWVQLPGIRRVDWEQRDQVLKDKRMEALKEIYFFEGWAGLLRLAEQVENAHSVGYTLLQAELIPGNQEAFLQEHIFSPNVRHQQMVLGFILASVGGRGNRWAEERLTEMQGWPPEQIARFLLCLPFSPMVMDSLDFASEGVRHSFWKSIRSAYLFDDIGQSKRVIKVLLDYQRPDIALEAIERAPAEQSAFLTPEQIADVLEAFVQTPLDAGFDFASMTYLSSELLDRLEKSELSRERLAWLEWHFLPIHEHHRAPRLMHEDLARKPEFFVEVLGQAYPVLGEEAEANAEVAARARMARVVLDSWRQIPGCKEDTINAEVLQQWVKTVRELAVACDKLRVVDHALGRVFAFSPQDSDGTWPHLAIREVMEDLSSPDVEAGWRTGVINSRGTTSRGLTDGGVQERNLAARYAGYAKQVGDAWPRTAAVLKGLAEEYRHQAIWHDERADLTQDFWR